MSLFDSPLTVEIPCKLHAYLLRLPRAYRENVGFLHAPLDPERPKALRAQDLTGASLFGSDQKI